MDIKFPKADSLCETFAQLQALAYIEFLNGPFLVADAAKIHQTAFTYRLTQRKFNYDDLTPCYRLHL